MAVPYVLHRGSATSSFMLRAVPSFGQSKREAFDFVAVKYALLTFTLHPLTILGLGSRRGTISIPRGPGISMSFVGAQPKGAGMPWVCQGAADRWVCVDCRLKDSGIWGMAAPPLQGCVACHLWAPSHRALACPGLVRARLAAAGCRMGVWIFSLRIRDLGKFCST